METKLNVVELVDRYKAIDKDKLDRNDLMLVGIAIGWLELAEELGYMPTSEELNNIANELIKYEELYNAN